MSLYRQSLDDLRHGLRSAHDRFDSSLREASREAAELSSQVASGDGSVEVAIRGDCSLESVMIDNEAYRRHTPDSLREAILDAYRRTVFNLSRQQHSTILRTVTPTA